MSIPDQKLISRDFKGIWITRDIWLNKDLSIHAKALWAEIDSLYDNNAGGCFASNDYLAEFLQVRISRLKEVLKELTDKGYLVHIKFDGRVTVRKAVMPSCGQQIATIPATSAISQPGSRLPQGRETGQHVLKPHILIENKDKNKEIAQSTSSLRKNDPFFSFESKKFEGISEEELKKWKELYPSVDIPKEIMRMEDWCLSNPSKAKSKKLWRKFISGWLARNNEEITNKQAFKQAKNANDRRPLDITGKPVENQFEGMF